MSKRYILDTGILLGYLSAAPYAKYVDDKFDLARSIPVTSIISIGELYAMAFRFQWDAAKMNHLAELLRKITPIPITDANLVEKYGEIESYNLNKHLSKKLPKGTSHRKMTQNDIWIAATGAVLKASLITTDKDFQHLNNVFLEVFYIDPQGQGHK